MISGASADNVNAEHLIGLGVHNHLHQRALLVAGEDVLHRAERWSVVLSLCLLARTLFGETDSPYGRTREHDARDIGMVKRRWRTEEFGGDVGHGLANGDRRQVDAIGDVTDRRDVRHARAGIFINGDGATIG